MVAHIVKISPPPVKSHNFDYVLEYDNSGDCDEDKYDDDAYWR